MSKRDYYEVLGINKSASDAEVKKAYKKAAMKYHPDRQSGDETKFKEVQEAYQVLSDAQKRATYDRVGHAGFDASMGGGNPFGAGGPFGGGNANFTDVFEDIFGDIFGGAAGGQSSQRRSQRGSDIRYAVEVTLEQAVHGASVEISVPTMVACKTCKGSGAKPGTKPVNCPTCEGHGQVRMQQGFFSIQQTCPNCHGVGTVIEKPCSTCQGQGAVEERKRLSVKIPAGVDNGDRIRLAGEGEAGMQGAPAGDLYVQIQVKQHAIFKRDGNHLHCEVPISFATAALGGEVEVPTLSGRIKLKIPTETQSGKVFRLRGRGVKPVRGGGAGDLMCHVVIETPVKLNAQQKELLNKFQQSLEADGDAHSPKARSWFDNVKQFFEGFRN